MTDKLPPNLLALFAPRPPLRYLPHNDHASEGRKTNAISGVAQFLPQLQEYADEVPYEATESWLQRRDRIKAEKSEKQKQLEGEGFAKFNPSEDPQVRGDAYKTLFVARLSYDTKETDLEKEFGRYGPIERIRIVTDAHDAIKEEVNGERPKKKKKKAHRGYAFIVYEREKDMKAAYKETDGVRINDRRVLVDVERGRTVKGWRPRRFGGGLGGRGYTKALPARPGGFSAPAGPGGFRSGFRGDFGGRAGGGFRGQGFRGGDRGAYSGRGVGYQGGGGFGGGGRGGGGYGGAPPNAPSGPGGGRSGHGGYGGPTGDGPGSGGYGDRPNGSFDDRSSRGGGRPPYGSDRDGRGFSSSNREPIRPRESRDGGYSDRDRRRDGDRGHSRRDDDYGSRKRYHDSDGHDDSRKRRY